MQRTGSQKFGLSEGQMWKFTENCVITLAKVSDFCYNVYRVGIGFDFNFHKKPYYITNYN